MSNYFNNLNEAVRLMNVCNSIAARKPGVVLSDGSTYAERAEYWRGEAEFYADELDTAIVEMPGNPGVFTAELFLNIAGIQ